MTQHPIIIIGGGNMGGAIASRWHAAQSGCVHVVEHDAKRRKALGDLGITTHVALEHAPLAASYLLAIKPQQFAGSIAEFKHIMSDREPLLISIMAGVPLSILKKISTRAVRVMPNLPAIIGESMSVACAPGLDTASQKTVTMLFDSIGAIAWVEDEEQLHAVTAISGSGPAYVFAFMEALQHAATDAGLDPELAAHLVAQTLRGAALLAEQSNVGIATLRAQVTSKGGTTEAALKTFTEGKLQALVTRAVKAADARSKSLASSS
jgi:pyrroline-5-carboxylate reductase